MDVLEERYRRHDELLQSMRSSGFFTQQQLRKKRPPSFKERLVDEILVGVGRDGRILLIDGRHRFAIASILGFESIPVQVGVRHPAWMAIRRDIASYARDHGGVVPQSLPHPDLDNIPSADDCTPIFEAVRDRLAPAEAILDVGALWGYYSVRLEEAGYDCTALEDRDEHRFYLEQMRTACDRRFRIDGVWPRQAPSDAGITSALALERITPPAARAHLERLLALLRHVPVATLFVRPPAPVVSGTAHGRRLFDAAWVDALSAGAGFTGSELITDVEAVPILRLSR
jgi:hypothetical protein